MLSFFNKKKYLAFFLVLFALFFNSCEDNGQATTVIEGNNASFEELKAKINTEYILLTTKNKTIVIDLKDNKLISKELEGKNVLLNFWATWCPPCIEEMPMLNKVYEKYKKDFVIIGILYEKDKDPKVLEAFIKKHKMKFPVTTSAENFRLAKNIGNVSRIPESFLYDKKGNFVKKYVGVIDEKELIIQLDKK